MTTSYVAIIEGKHCEITGIDDVKEQLVLANGQRYTFHRLPADQRQEEPTVDIFGRRLLEIVKLTPWEGDWKWNDNLETDAQWMESENGNLKPDDAEITKRGVARSRLNALPPEIRATVGAIAWFEHDDCAGGWHTPILLSGFRQLLASAKLEEVTGEAVNHLKIAADAMTRQIRSVSSELRAATEQLAEVAQPFREMYKDERLAKAKADALKLGIPELVIDSIVSFYHKSKLPTTDGLLKYLNDSGLAPKLGSAGNGTSRATIGRWLKSFKRIMRLRGLIQPARIPKNNINENQADNSNTVINLDTAADQSGLTSTDTRPQELPESCEVE